MPKHARTRPAFANGQLASQSALLKDQIKKQERNRQELMGLLQAAAAANDEENGAHYAEELAQLEQDIADNKEQVDNLEALYKQNTEIIAHEHPRDSKVRARICADQGARGGEQTARGSFRA